MPLTPGLMPNIRQEAPEEEATLFGPSEIMIEDGDENVDQKIADEDGNILQIEHPDGSITISMTDEPLERAEEKENSEDWFDNLVEEIGQSELSNISSELMRGIRDDLQSRKDWIEDRAQGLKLMGLKIEIPGLQGGADGAPVEGMSKVRHPLLLEAVLRFQANARSELLPTDGPVKIRNDATQDVLDSDLMANHLQKDMNHYLTSRATEYYPDTDRMLLMLGFGGSAFKKVYNCPLRNRPVSESVDADDLVVNNAATDLQNAKRITHRTYMRPSTVKRLQILGVYRDVDLSTPKAADIDAVQREKNAQQGVSAESNNPDDRDREIYECYCELNIKGFEHKWKGKVTGLEIPYRVTIDASSKEILSVVRNYDEDSSELPEARANFVKYTFVPGMGFYDIGLLHILGNTTNALTAAWRELLDAGMYANFPGFLMADTGARQNTNIFRVPPGGGALVKTGGMKLSDAISPLPYKEPSAALMSLVENMAATGMRVGGTSEMQVGEGRPDAPVGTTLAMIEQAEKILNAVHKRMHAAQAAEFQLLVRCFKENPESFWRNCKKMSRQWDEQQFLNAIEDCDLVPQADPNTASHGQRLMKVYALKQMAASNPTMYDQLAIDTVALKEMGWSNPEQFFAPEEQRKQPPPEVQKGMAEIQIKQQDAATRQKAVDAKVMEMQHNASQSMGQNMGLPPGLDISKLGELAIKKQDMDIKNKAIDAKMLYDQARISIDQAKLELERAKMQSDPMAEAEMQAKLAEAEMKMRDLEIKSRDVEMDATNRHNERESRERIAMANIIKEVAQNPESASLVQGMISPMMRKGLEEPG